MESGLSRINVINNVTGFTIVISQVRFVLPSEGVVSLSLYCSSR